MSEIENRWPDSLVDQLAQKLFEERRRRYINFHDEWSDLTKLFRKDWRDTAIAAMNFCADLDVVETSVAFRMGYTMGALKRPDAIKYYIERGATQADLDAAYDALLAIVKRGDE